MAPIIISTPKPYELHPLPLTQSAFSDFGTVISNPHPRLTPSAKLPSLPQNAIQANQGSALKYQDVSEVADFYSSAPSGVPAKAVMNMFVCAPRKLKEGGAGGEGGVDEGMGRFEIEILERHPFTSQTFIPLGLAKAEKGGEKTRFLVVVAPSLPAGVEDQDLPVPKGVKGLPGRGLPDLTKIRAFVATGDQAVTYGAGTWHAPMVVIGDKPISFVVVQHANAVAIEDCQEVVWKRDGAGKTIEVVVPKLEQDNTLQLWSKL